MVPLCTSASISDFQFLCYNSYMLLFMHVCSGWNFRLRLGRLACAVQNTSNCSEVIAACSVRTGCVLGILVRLHNWNGDRITWASHSDITFMLKHSAEALVCKAMGLYFFIEPLLSQCSQAVTVFLETPISKLVWIYLTPHLDCEKFFCAFHLFSPTQTWV